MRKLALVGLLAVGLVLAGSQAFAQTGNNNMATVTAKAHIFKPVTVDATMVQFGKIQGPKEGTAHCDLNAAGEISCENATPLGGHAGGTLSIADGPVGPGWDYEIEEGLVDESGKVTCVESENTDDTSVMYDAAFYPSGSQGESNTGTLVEGKDTAAIGGSLWFDATSMGWYTCELMVTVNLVMQMVN